MEGLVDLVARHGVAIVFLNVLVEQVGLAVPAVPTLIVAGALAAKGQLSASVFAAAVIACYIGDGLWFAGGRIYGHRVMRLLCRISLSPDSCVRQSEYHFGRWGKAALVVSKFVPGLSAVTPPLAGAMRMGWPSFRLLNGAGIVLWSAIPIGAGMLFNDQIGQVIAVLERYGARAAALIVAALAAYIALKWWERRRFYRALRLARITVEELRGLHQRGKRPVVVDVRSAVARKVVFYCSCPNEASAAQQLIGLGYTRVRPLAGGLDAWFHSGVT